MKLPNLNNAFVPPPKIRDYLLSEENSGGKAAFFTHFGFSVAQWEVLAEALYEHVSTHEVAQAIRDERGTKYIVEGGISTPDGRYPLVRAVWLIENGMEAARFITAYPI